MSHKGFAQEVPSDCEELSLEDPRYLLDDVHESKMYQSHELSILECCGSLRPTTLWAELSEELNPSCTAVSTEHCTYVSSSPFVHSLESIDSTIS